MSTLETRRDDFSHFIPGNAKGSNQALYKKCHVDATRRQNFGQMHTYVDLSKHHQAIRRTSVEVIGVRTTFQYHFTKLLSQVTLSHLDIIACWTLGTDPGIWYPRSVVLWGPSLGSSLGY
jgi:hypothetical protein